MRKALIFLTVLILISGISGDARILDLIGGQGCFNTLGKGTMPPFKSAFGYSAILLLDGFSIGTKRQQPIIPLSTPKLSPERFLKLSDQFTLDSKITPLWTNKILLYPSSRIFLDHHLLTSTRISPGLSLSPLSSLNNQLTDKIFIRFFTIESSERAWFEVKYGLEVENILANRSKIIGKLKTSAFGVLGKILLKVEKEPITFLITVGYGFYQGNYTLILGDQKAVIEEESGGAKVGITGQIALYKSLTLTVGGSYRAVPVFSKGKELNFSGFEISAGIGFSL